MGPNQEEMKKELKGNIALGQKEVNVPTKNNVEGQK